MRRPVVINWGIASYYGWGVYGLNLALHWANDPDVELACAHPIYTEHIVTDPLRLAALQPFLTRSRQLEEALRPAGGRVAVLQAGVLTAVGGDFAAAPAAHGVALRGSPTIASTFFEEALTSEALRRAATFDLVVAGSTWNERILRGYGLERVQTVLQGIDTCLFHPAEKLGVLGDRFLVFSGGKAELRKGQDIVLAAFRAFAARHPDAVLVTAWHSPWPRLAASLDRSGLVAPVRFDANGNVDVLAWAAANGVDPAQVIDLGQPANAHLPPILREMDVAVFPNRCEGGTNLVAMECMACAVPTVLSAGTGHLDLAHPDRCLVLHDQKPSPHGFRGIAGVQGWTESSVDEVVAALEEAYERRDLARQRASAGAEWIRTLSWSSTASQLKNVILSL